MHELRRISLVNWYAFEIVDIELVGTTALIGPNGVGKSSLLDAIQTVMTGNGRGLHLNAAASAVKKTRSVRDYCVGKVDDLPAPLRRDGCESLLALVFIQPDGTEPVSIGLALKAHPDDGKEDTIGRWIAPGLDFRTGDFLVDDEEGERAFPLWDELLPQLQDACASLREYKKAHQFVGNVLASMRKGPQPNAQHFRRIFSNAVAFRPIGDTNLFVRDYILEPDPLEIDRVRASIQTYRGFVRAIEECKMKQEQLIRIRNQFLSWGSHYVTHANDTWLAEKAEAFRLEFEIKAAEESVRKATGELEKLRNFRERRKTEIDAMESELRQKRGLLAADGIEVAVNGLIAQRDSAREKESEIGRSVDELRWIAAELNDLQELAPYCPTGDLKTALATAGQMKHLLAEPDAARLLADSASAIDAGLAKLPELEPLIARWRLTAEQLNDLVAPKRAEARQLRSQGQSMAAGGSRLSEPAQRLQRELQDLGVESVALPDVVDIVDDEWAYALEALLGNARYALIVPPLKLRRAFDHLYKNRNRDGFKSLTLVKTDRVHQDPRPLPKGSIAEIIRTDDKDARAFIEARVGGFIRAENEEDLRRLGRGIMRNGKATSGLGLSVNPDLVPVLGKTNLAAKANRLLARATQLEREAKDEGGDAPKLTAGSYKLQQILAEVDRLERSAATLDTELQTSRLRQRALERDIEAEASKRDQTLVQEIKDLDEAVEAYKNELDNELESEIDDATTAKANAVSRLERFREQAEKTAGDLQALAERHFTEEYEAILELDRRLSSYRSQLQELETRIVFDWEGRERAELAQFRNQKRPKDPRVENDLNNRKNGAVQRVADYCHEWDIDHPDRVAADAIRLWRWVGGQLARIETNELVAYEEEARRARQELEISLKEDLLNRLAEKLKRVEQQLEELNDALGQRYFAGSLYRFERQVDQRFAHIYRLATAVHANPMESLETVATPARGVDEGLAEAMAELEAEIERSEGQEGDIADYRKYFTFELTMKSETGHKTRLTDRLGNLSGGQGQLAFYVAIAASLALAYYPSSRGLAPSGMGLALFDEAFNKIDPHNTKQLFTLFKQMGLQLFVAVPETDRPTFTEVCNSVITINRAKDYSSMYLSVVHPRDRLRQALATENPDNYEPAEFVARLQQDGTKERTEAAQ